MPRSVPGLGPILAARVLAEVGDDPARFATANGLRAFAGTAPITRASDPFTQHQGATSPHQASRRRLS
ncbi:transposase [Rhodococcus koreensis]